MTDHPSTLTELLRQSAARLAAAGARDEAVAELRPARRRFLIWRPATMLPRGRAWRLGVLLLTEAGELLAAGPATTARERGRAGYQSLSLEERRDVQAAALRGGYGPGESVNYDAEPIDLAAASAAMAAGEDWDGGPLLIRSGAALVRWRPGADAASCPPAGRYLTERVELLADPPGSA